MPLWLNRRKDYSMGDISKYFNRSEIACKCGCGFDTMDGETLDVADDAREFVDHAITPSSGARCYEYNRLPISKRGPGSNDSSQHPRGRAIDVPVKDPKALYYYLCNKYPDKYGFGLYKTFVHIDTKSGAARRW